MVGRPPVLHNLQILTPQEKAAFFDEDGESAGEVMTMVLPLRIPEACNANSQARTQTPPPTFQACGSA